MQKIFLYHGEATNMRDRSNYCEFWIFWISFLQKLFRIFNIYSFSILCRDIICFWYNTYVLTTFHLWLSRRQFTDLIYLSLKFILKKLFYVFCKAHVVFISIFITLNYSCVILLEFLYDFSLFMFWLSFWTYSY